MGLWAGAAADCVPNGTERWRGCQIKVGTMMRVHGVQQWMAIWAIGRYGGHGGDVGMFLGFSQQQQQVAEKLGTSSLKRRLLAGVSAMQGSGSGSEQTSIFFFKTNTEN